MERLFVDTSAWFAFGNKSDPDHKRVVKALARFGGRLVSSSFIFDETITLCAYRLGHRAAAVVGRTLLDPEVLDLVQVSSDDERRAWDLFLAREDQAYSFTDCTSFVLMRRLELRRAAALDADFQREGFEITP
jgi:predicted nucleic acid-binding protein